MQESRKCVRLVRNVRGVCGGCKSGKSRGASAGSGVCSECEADARTGNQEVSPLGQEYVRSVKRMQEEENKK